MDEQRNERDFQTNLTLTERVSRIERIVTDHFQGLMQDEGDDFRAARHINVEDEPEFGRGTLGRWDYREAQQFRNEQMSQRVGATNTTSNAFEEIINRIQSIAERARTQAIKLEEIGERIFGPIPEDKNQAGGGATDMPEGTLNHTHMSLDWLDACMDRLHAAAVRLERI